MLTGGFAPVLPEPGFGGERDGTTLATYPVTGGDADHTTWSGIMVISERFKETRMESSTVGLGDEYDIKDVPHAQRLTTSGIFVHGNYWAAESVFGSSNVSHGCVGLHDTKGAGDNSVPDYRFYDSSMLGDVAILLLYPADTETSTTPGTSRRRPRRAGCSSRTRSWRWPGTRRSPCARTGRRPGRPRPPPGTDQPSPHSLGRRQPKNGRSSHFESSPP